MLELEVCAAGGRDLNKIVELEIELGPIAPAELRLKTKTQLLET